MKEYKYKTTFAAKILPIDSNKMEKIVSYASKNDNLAKLLPKSVNLTENIGFQLFESEAFLVNKLNLNSDGVMTAAGMMLKESAPLGFIDLDHSRKNLVGVIVNSTYTDIDTGKEISEDKIKNTNEPFAVTITGIVWRAPNPDLADAIGSINDKDSEYKNTIFCSWEVCFDQFDLVLIDKDKFNISEGKLITDQSEVEELSKKLLTYGGSGFTDDGKKIGRIPIGEVTCLGVGLVGNPAGQISSIVVPKTKEESNASNLLSELFIEKLKSLPESGMGYQICDIEMNDGSIVANISIHNCSILSKELNINDIKDIKLSSKISLAIMVDKTNREIDKINIENNEKIISQAQKDNVITNNDNILHMIKIEKIEQLTDENLKEIKTASEIKELFANSNQALIQEGINKISQDYTKKIEEKDSLIKAANEGAQELQKKVKEVEDKLTDINSNYSKLVEANKQREQVESFSARMETIENSFDLDDKQKEIVANKVKTLPSDEEFNKYLAEIEVLLAAKKKVAKPTKKNPDPDNDGDDDTTKNGDTDKDNAGKNKKEAKASVEEAIKNGEQDKKNIIPNAGAKEETLSEKAKKAFGIEGWSIVDKRKNRI